MSEKHRPPSRKCNVLHGIIPVTLVIGFWVALALLALWTTVSASGTVVGSAAYPSPTANCDPAIQTCQLVEVLEFRIADGGGAVGGIYVDGRLSHCKTGFCPWGGEYTEDGALDTPEKLAAFTKCPELADVIEALIILEEWKALEDRSTLVVGERACTTMSRSSYYQSSESGYYHTRPVSTYTLPTMTITSYSYGGPDVVSRAEQNFFSTQSTSASDPYRAPSLPVVAVPPTAAPTAEPLDIMDGIREAFRRLNYDIDMSVAELDAAISSCIGGAVELCAQLIYPDYDEGSPEANAVGPWGSIAALKGPAVVGDAVVLGATDGRLSLSWLEWLMTHQIPGKTIGKAAMIDDIIVAAPQVDFQLAGMVDDVAHASTYTARELRLILGSPTLEAKTTFWVDGTQVSGAEVRAMFRELIQ